MISHFPRITDQKVHRQKGAALIVSLILLTVITVLSLSAARNTNLDTKISTNHQHKQLSFQAAENALAKVTGENPNISVPATPGAANTINTDYFTATSVDGQPDVAANVEMDFVRISRPGEFKFSGFGLALTSLIYQADSTGRLVNGTAQSHNRMGLALVRD